ncbi:MAG TPA: molybdopterin-dependent oxidoreductase [Spirochaetia bacterium]|nr:molybdopterin-dependent oxidoreductase [Spirochaetia bacterium]
MKGLFALSLVLSLLLPVGLAASGRTEEISKMQEPSAATVGSFGVGVVDGLHLTGTPIDVNIDEYRLKISGLVDRPLSVSYDDLRSMRSVRRSAILVCPGVFRDEGMWTGVPLKSLLDRAGLRVGAATVVFRSIDGSYEQKLPLAEARSSGVYLAYAFNGKIFDPRNGYPLRLVAEGEAGSVWVKWLGEIEVIGK